MKFFSSLVAFRIRKLFRCGMMLLLGCIQPKFPFRLNRGVFSPSQNSQPISRHARKCSTFLRFKKETWIILLLLVFIWIISTRERLITLHSELILLNFALATKPAAVHFEEVPSDPDVWITLPTHASTSMPKRLTGQEETVKLPFGPIPHGAIHFLTTSSPGSSPRARELCSIESAALSHPDKVVVVSLQLDELYVNPIIKGLSRNYTNIAFIRLDMGERLNGTILKDWYVQSNIANSKYAATTMSDIARIVTLYKYGGYYLDSDVIVLQRFANLRNAAPFDSNLKFVANFVMVFDRGHPLLWDFMTGVLNRYESQIWKTEPAGVDLLYLSDVGAYFMMGPQALTDTVLEHGWCKKSWISIDPASCRDGFTLLPEHAFQPIPIVMVKPLLLLDGKSSTKPVVSRLLDDYAYGFHLFNNFNKRNRIILDPNVMITEILMKRCPVTCKMAGTEL